MSPQIFFKRIIDGLECLDGPYGHLVLLLFGVSEAASLSGGKYPGFIILCQEDLGHAHTQGI